MTKIDELISNVSYIAFEEFGENRVVSIEDVSDIMKIYAEWYAKKCVSHIYDNHALPGELHDQVVINDNVFINLKLLDHE